MRTTPDQFMASLALPEVYRVGGSVRDELLGRRSKDSDYVVRCAGLGEIAAALVAAGTKPTPLKLRDGRQVGWRTLVKGWGLIEVVLPRTERKLPLSPEQAFGNERHSFEIITDPDLPLAEDAQRRDFTINALYRDVKGGSVIDPLGVGLDHLQKQRIDTTHPDSFRDDPLRTLRALRFVSRLDGFALSGPTLDQMRRHADAVTGLTGKGVSGTALHELSGMLMGDRPGYALRLARDTGVLQVILPELTDMIGFQQRSAYHTKTTDEHTFDAVQAAANMHEHAPLRVRWALLFHDSGKPDTAWIGKDGRQHYYGLGSLDDLQDWRTFRENMTIDHEMHGARRASAALHRLNAPARLRMDVVTLIDRHMLPLHDNVKPFKVRKWRAELGDDMLRDLITHRLADVIGKGGDITDACDVLEWIEHQRERAAAAGVPKSRKELAVSGGEIAAALEREPGAWIGNVQRALLHEVLANPTLNDKDWLLQRAARLAVE
jgi:tRNA nucleotidyltransferase (CCA-adding enzyme)